MRDITWRRAASAVAMAVALTACAGGGDGSQGGTADGAATPVAGSDEVVPATEQTIAPVPSDSAVVEEIAAAIDASAEGLRAPMNFQENPMARYDIPLEMYDDTIAALDILAADLPDGDGVSGAPIAAAYANLVAAVETWRIEAGGAKEELEALRPELEPQLDEWFAALESDGDPGGPPPQRYTELIDVNFAASERFGQACAAFASAAEVAPACFGSDGDGPPPDDAGTVEIEIGSLRATVDVGIVQESFVVPGLAGFDLAERVTLTFGPTFPVRDPAAPIESSTQDLGGAELDRTVPWPDDLGAYLAELPIDVVRDEIIQLPAGTFRALVLTQDEVAGLALIDNEANPQGSIQVRSGAPLYLWVGEVGGQELLVTLEVGSTGADLFVEQAESALASLTPIG